MKSNRRVFLKALGLGFSGIGFFGLGKKETWARIEKKLNEVKNVPENELARDEDFWFEIQRAFDVDRSIINLNNGGVHPVPRCVMEAVRRYMDFSNAAPAYNMWKLLSPRRELVREKLAEIFGCSPEEIALTRNVTESMQIALLGIELKPGDEVLTTTHDYPSMKNALFQREKREGIRVKMFSFPTPPDDLGILVDLFRKNVTPKTKMILMCHMTNLTGQIFPVKEICEMARERNIEVVVDGAHAIGHFDFKLKDIDCDIYGANLHKWMMAPIGTGFLYVRKEKVKKIWPLFPSPDPLGEDIRKFEFIGTHPEYLEVAVAEALAFHQGIGGKRKEERLRYLKDYWANALKKLPGVKFLTSFNPSQSCGLGTFVVEKMDMPKLSQVLFERHKIYTIPVTIPEGMVGIRVTPSIYTSLDELSRFIECTAHYIKHGLPG